LLKIEQLERKQAANFNAFLKGNLKWKYRKLIRFSNYFGLL